GPEELESPYFKIQSTLEPHNLVETSKRILQAVNTKPALTYSYCLEVLFEDDKAFFTLCLNPVLWFDVYLRKKDLETSARIARTYVTNARLTVSYENDILFNI
ncbi:9515_t:CDS:1, partial [Paraglomus brasilianum]